MGRLLTPKEVCEKMGRKSADAFRRRFCKVPAIIPYTKDGERYLFDEEDVSDYLAARRVAPRVYENHSLNAFIQRKTMEARAGRSRRKMWAKA